MYSHRRIPLPVILEFEATDNDIEFIGADGQHVHLLKIAICQVPTAAGGYKDFSLVAVFDIRVALLYGADSEWIVLTEPKSHIFYNYSDAILHNGLVFATTHTGTVHAWKPQQAGNFPPDVVYDELHYSWL